MAVALSILLVATGLLLCATQGYDSIRQDPTPIIYPGQMNVGILADLHKSGKNATLCGPLNKIAVQHAMAAVWAAHQVNFRKDPQELNIGVYIYDTCGRQDVAQRQLYQLVGHVGHVQSAACVEKKAPPVFGILAQGDQQPLYLPLKMLEAFSVPTILTIDSAAEAVKNFTNTFATTPTLPALARATVSTLRRLGFWEVAVISQDSMADLKDHMSREAKIAGIEIIPMDQPLSGHSEQMLLKSLEEQNTNKKKTPAKALVFLLSDTQAIQLLKSVGTSSSPKLPWIIVTPNEIFQDLQKSLPKSHLLLLNKILLISPITTHIPEFHSYFQQLLKEDTIIYHPLLIEFLQAHSNQSFSMNTPIRLDSWKSRKHTSEDFNYIATDVSATVKAIWSFAAALKVVQKRSCRRGSDCLLYLRRVLTSYMNRALKALDFSFRSSGIISLEGTELKFGNDRTLSTIRYGICSISSTGDAQKVGWYSEDNGLILDHVVLSSTNLFHADLDATPDVVYQSQLSTSPTNFHSISLSSHQEPLTNARKLPPLMSSIKESSGPSFRVSLKDNADVHPLDTGHVTTVRHTSLSFWLGRPWALTLLGISGFGVLVTLFILVFLLMKACEGALQKNNSLLTACQLFSLLALYGAAILFTWKPSSNLCGLQRFVPNVAYAFCHGSLLLHGMHLKSQSTLGLGGSVSRFNQLLTLIFIVGVQIAMETQWWIMRPPLMLLDTSECMIGKEEILLSQVYIVALIILTILVSFTVWKIPYTHNEGKCLTATSLISLAFFLAWGIACWLLPDSSSRNIAAPITLIITAIIVLIGVFGPQLYVIHKYGGFPHKPLSYADSLSTVFSMFKDVDNVSGESTTKRGKKSAKTPDTPYADELMEGTRNPLYNDFQSAYP